MRKLNRHQYQEMAGRRTAARTPEVNAHRQTSTWQAALRENSNPRASLKPAQNENRSRNLRDNVVMTTGTIVQHPETKSRSKAGNLTLFFAIGYISHGIAMQFGLISQPVQYFLMKGLNLSAAQVSSCLAIMMMPWVLKPFMGLVCDFLPLLGYRRKSYIIAANALTAIAFLVMSLTSSLPIVLGTLMLTAIGMALSTALMAGLATEKGRIDGNTRDYFSAQAMYYYAANILAAVAGGWLCNNLVPGSALNVAAGVAAVPVFVVSLVSFKLLNEEKTTFDLPKMRETWTSFKGIFQSRALWITAAFAWCWNFTPAFGVPLYFFQSNTLHFAQSSIGQLVAWNSAGMMLGAYVYKRFVKDLPIRLQLGIIIALVSSSTLAYFFLSNVATAVVLEAFRGMASLIGLLFIYALAAENCPPRTEVSVIAAMIAVRNFAVEASTFAGGNLFTHVFHNSLAPLLVLTAVFPILSVLLFPLIARSNSERLDAHGLSSS